MTTITLSDLQHDLLGLLRKVEAGETLILVHADKPVAEIKPVPPRDQQLRPFGLCAGEFVVPEDFDYALPEDVLRQFEGE